MHRETKNSTDLCALTAAVVKVTQQGSRENINATARAATQGQRADAPQVHSKGPVLISSDCRGQIINVTSPERNGTWKIPDYLQYDGKHCVAQWIHTLEIHDVACLHVLLGTAKWCWSANGGVRSEKAHICPSGGKLQMILYCWLTWRTCWPHVITQARAVATVHHSTVTMCCSPWDAGCHGCCDSYR